MAELLESSLLADPDSAQQQEQNADKMLPNCDSSEPELPKAPLNMSPGAVKLRGWLNKSLRIKMSDGRVLIGIFLCTDRDTNIILGSCSEYLPDEEICETDAQNVTKEESRMLGLVMVPGKHIVSVAIYNNGTDPNDVMLKPFTEDMPDDEII